MTVPLIDLFAGPGGLGEGFSRARSADFHVAVSIEKDEMAFETLQLRAAHRALLRSAGADAAIWSRWDAVVSESPWNVTFEMLRSSGCPEIRAACEVARRDAWNIELGPEARDVIRAGIASRLEAFEGLGRLPDNAVLIGGPPCQAYSVVGRSRNRGTQGYRAENDHRHYLYREYLQVIHDFRPAVFVMENVKGILSSRVNDGGIFQTIMSDLKRPDLACGHDSGLEYVLVALSGEATVLLDPAPRDFILEAERFGVPQARHRVVICGIRCDVLAKAGSVGRPLRRPAPTVQDVIGDLPPLRSELSFRGKGQHWNDYLSSPLMSDVLRSLDGHHDSLGQRVASRMKAAVRTIRERPDPGIGADREMFSSATLLAPNRLGSWYHDRPIRLLANHGSRSHMPADLVRYLFVSAFGRETRRSPKLGEFPTCLLPDHRNIDRSAPQDAIFKDRFRVQLSDSSSTTVTSHIAKDGHAFIHHDETQCRSLTVREAARLQTFPDSYVFLGNRTSQYTQVGNAVPPYLAVQIAEVVGDLMSNAGMV